MKHFLFFLLSVMVLSNASAQEPPDKGLEAITVGAVEGPLKFLSSDWTEGREVGTRGAYMAADYIASVFQMYDIKPLGDMAEKRLSREFKLKGQKPQSYRSYFQNFDLITETRARQSELQWTKTTGVSSQVKRLIEGVDFQLPGKYGTMELDAPVVFLGYGVKNKALKCDPFQKSDLNGKIVFILSGFAGINDQKSINYTTLKKDSLFSVNQLEREKIENARKAGAIAVFKYSPGKKFQSATPSNLPMFYDNEFYEGDKKQDDFYLKKISLPNWDKTPQIPVIEISRVVAEALLPGAESLLPEMQKPGYNMAGFKAREIDNSRFRFKISGDQKVFRARNVLGYIEGEDTDEVIVIGGHYDHVGKYNGFVFNGADDNASGTVGMLTLARAIKESGKKPAKTIVFAAWTGEEQGLWGSKYFVKNIPDNLKVALNINLDMIGRTSIQDSTDNYLRIQYSKGHENFEKVFNKVNQTNRLSLDLRYKVDEQPKGGSDFVPFAAEGVPVIALFTGLHRDYHHPNDELEFIDLDKMTKIIQLTYLGLTDIVGFK